MSVNDTTRIRKPQPTRVDPERNIGGLIGRVPSARQQTNAGKPAAESLVERGVRAGYEVIDEYLNEGRSAAKDFADVGADAAPASLEQLTERMFQHASDLGSVWMDLLRTINRRPHDDSSHAQPGGFSTNEPRSETAECGAQSDVNAARAASDVPVSVIVSSPLPVRVDVRLHGSPPAAGGVAAHPPRRADDDQPLRGVSVEWSPHEKRLSVCLSLSADVEPGIYTSALVARSTNLPFGTLCVGVQAKLEAPGVDAPR